MKTRIIRTDIFSTPEFIEFTDKEKLILFHIFTSERLGNLPACRIPLGEIAFYCQTTVEIVKNSLPKLKFFGVHYIEDGGWFVIEDKYTYANIDGGKKDQARKSEYNLFPPNLQKLVDIKGNIDQSLTNYCPIIDQSLGSINNKEEIINNKYKIIKQKKENKIKEKKVKVIGTEESRKYIEEFNKLFKANYQLTETRVNKFHARLENKEITEEKIHKALQALARSKWHQGQNESGWRADPDFLIRNDEMVDKWLQKAEIEYREKHHGGMSESEIMEQKRASAEAERFFNENKKPKDFTVNDRKNEAHDMLKKLSAKWGGDTK